jgi:hypothetical protein
VIVLNILFRSDIGRISSRIIDSAGIPAIPLI